MKRQRTLVLLLVFLVVIWPPVAWGDSISDVRLSPSRPASLSYGEEIKITFKYSTNYAGGVRIWPRPMTGGKRSPNYAASGHFTIRSKDVFVDGIRFEIRTDDKDSSVHRAKICIPISKKILKKSRLFLQVISNFIA